MVIELGRVRAGQKVIVSPKKKVVVPTKAAARAIYKREVAAGRAAPARVVKEKAVPFKVGAPTKPTPIVKPAPIPIRKARPPLRERIAVRARRVGEEAKQFIVGIPRGAKAVATLPFARLVYVDPTATRPYIGVPPKGAKTLAQQQAEEFEKATIGGKIGEFFGGITFGAVTTPPLVKHITPTTRAVTVTKVTPKGEFKAVGVIEAGEKVYPVAVKGRAARVPTTRITAVRGEAVIRAKPTIRIGAKPAKAFKFEGFKFRAISKVAVKTPKKEFRLALGEVTRVTKAVVRKGVPRIRRVRAPPKLFVGRKVVTRITPTKAIAAAKIDIFKGLTKVGEVKEIGFIKQVPKGFPRIVRAPRGLPTIPRAAITRAGARQITKGVIETIAPSLAKMKTGLPLAPRIPRARPITRPRVEPVTRVMPKEMTMVEPVTITAPKVRPIERAVTLPREAMKVRPITQPIIKPIVMPVTKVTPIQTVRPIQMIAPRVKPVTRVAYPTMPFAPITATMPKYPVGGFVPFAIPFSLGLPRAKPLAPLPISRKVSYQPSIGALVDRVYGEAPKWGLPIRERPISPAWKKKMQMLFGGF